MFIDVDIAMVMGSFIMSVRNRIYIMVMVKVMGMVTVKKVGVDRVKVKIN